MYLPVFEEFCPKCGAKVVRAAFSAKNAKVCKICGKTYRMPVIRLGAEKTKPAFRFTWEKVVLTVSILILLAFIVGIDFAQSTV